MTKLDLQMRVKELEKQIKEYEHLSSAIDAKDKEISELVNKHQEHITDLENKKSSEIEDLMKRNEINVKNIDEKYEKSIENLRERLVNRERQLSKLINFHGNLLKGLQGQLDGAIELNEYFVMEVQNGSN